MPAWTHGDGPPHAVRSLAGPPGSAGYPFPAGNPTGPQGNAYPIAYDAQGWVAARAAVSEQAQLTLLINK
eukprot:7471274-Heterocapsa_arctica.AAC.1